MTIQLDHLFPNLKSGLEGVGFIFGAGTSVCAGYPLTLDLTKKIFFELTDDEKESIEKILANESIPANFKEGIPDIEVVSNTLFKYSLAGVDPKIPLIEEKISGLLVSVLIDVKPKLDTHVRFLKALKKIMQNKKEIIYIFTTNYDLVFELAAMEARIPIYNGFEGVLARYFDIDRIDLSRGHINERNVFSHDMNPSIHLVKLHGSISWYKTTSGDVLEASGFDTVKDKSRTMILPKISKVSETLEHPYDKLFRYASRTIGSKCKYLVSCGYSFRDQHINEQLLFPKMRDNNIRLVGLSTDAFCCIDDLMQYSSFNYVFRNKFFVNGIEGDSSSEVYYFENFVELFAKYAGI